MKKLPSTRWLAASALTLIAACEPAAPPVSPPAPTASAAPSASAPAPPPAAPSGPDANRARADVPDAYKWKLDVLFANDEAFEAGLKSAAESRKQLATFEGKLAKPASLLACLDLYFKTRLLTNKLTLYANMRFDTDVRSTTLQGMNDRALDAMKDLISSAGFIRREVLALPDAAMTRAYKAEPKLAELRPYLDEMRRRKSRVLGADGERVLALAGDNLWAEIDLNELPSDFEKAFSAMLADLKLPKVKDDKGEEVQLTLSNYGVLRGSANPDVRKGAWEGLMGTLRSHENAIAADLAGQVRFNIFLARSRGYSSARDAYLDKDNIDPAVYDSLLRAVNANIAPLHRYVQLRKKLMGLPEVHLYDLYTPMVKSVEMHFTYEEAAKVLPDALAPLGEDYGKVLRQGLDPKNGWIDVFPHKDKKSGAFSASVFGVHPFVKMNYFEDLDGLSTLAHEYGHALHSHLAMTHQPYVSWNYVPFLAEIASTINEKLLSDHLLARAKTKEEKLYLLNELVDRIRTTIYRQALFAQFEHEIHAAAEKGAPLTAELLDKTYGRLLRAYYGPDITFGPNDETEWAYIPHLYYKYYVFTYATGLSAGIAMASKIGAGDTAARDAYLGMLKGGSSRPPLDLLKGAGVDLTKPAAIEEAARVMDAALTEMEKTLAAGDSK
ncbi:MAG: oligoendopeptidase F [Polyangiaceae bacterium]